MLAKASQKVREEGYLDYSYEELTELLTSIKEAFSERSMNEIAFQYVLSSPVVAAVIPGASSPEQLRENAAAVKNKPLSEEEVTLLRSLAKLNVYEAHRI